MSRVNTGGIPAAAGYPQYSGYLTSPVTSNKIIELYKCGSIYQEIATTEYLGEIQGKGDQVQFFRQPEVIIRDHIKDGRIKHDTLEAKQITLSIDEANEFSFKMAMVDESQMENWPMFREAMMNSAVRTMAQRQDTRILGSIYADAAPANRGANAGLESNCYNLGTPGAPAIITKDNVLDTLIALGAVLDEQCIPADSRWIVVPPKFKQLLLSSPILSVAQSSGLQESTMLNGRLPQMIGGFNIYVSNNLTRVTDPVTNLPTYNIIAGYKGAFVYANHLAQTRQTDDAHTWDHYYQGLMVWGFGTIQPTGLVHLYASMPGN
jgi:hypothetical protein